MLRLDMTVPVGERRQQTQKVIVLPNAAAEQRSVFSLPHPSNNTSKQRIKLLQCDKDSQLYEVSEHTFSKGCLYSRSEDLANDKYHYTDDSQPLKSIFLVNENNRKDGMILQEGGFEYTTKYDLAFNIIGFFYNSSISTNEQEYANSKTSTVQSAERVVPKGRFLNLRDYHDILIEQHDASWRHVPLETLQVALKNIAEEINEAGDIYYKVTEDKILEYLCGKIKKICNNFPQSLPLPISSLPSDITVHAKTVMAANLLISLIPKEAYYNLTKDPDGPAVSRAIRESFVAFEEFQKSILKSTAEKDMMIKAAMTIGLDSNSKPNTNNKVIKKSNTIAKKPKVAIGKGAIDGFFKKAR